MWKRSFVATTVALGDGLDSAVDALGGAAELEAGAAELVRQLGAPQRPARAAALAKAVHEIARAVDEGALR